MLLLIAAAVALVISVASLRLSRSTQKKRLKLQETQAAVAEYEHGLLAAEQERGKQAELRVELVGPQGQCRFVFSNAGPGVARNVSFTFADAGGWSPPVISAQFHEIFPIKELPPNQQHSCIAALHLGHPPVFTGIYSWEDVGGVKHQTTCKIPVRIEV